MAALLIVLLDAALKGTLLLFAGAVLIRWLRGRGAAARHLVWSIVLAIMLMLPGLARMLPHWTVPVLVPPSVTSRLASRAAASNDPSDHVAPVRFSRRDRDSSVERRREWSPVAMVSSAAAMAVWPTIVLGIWGAGALVGLTIILAGVVGVSRTARRARHVAEGSRWIPILNAARRELGIARSVRLLASDRASMPATWGVFQPTVLLPHGAEDWSADRQRTVLLHELAHVARHDCLTQFVAQCCCAVYWFHPLVWVAARRMLIERELACDEVVLGRGASATEYATHLLDVARLCAASGAAPGVAVAMARGSDLEMRLRRVLAGGDRRRLRRSDRFVLGSLIAVAALPLAALRPWPERRRVPVVSDVAPVERIIAAPLDTVSWHGRVASGRWIELIVSAADIDAVPTAGDSVEIIAMIPHAAPEAGGARFISEPDDDGVRLCLAMPHDDRDASRHARHSCSTTTMSAAEFAQAQVVVRVPSGVRFAAQSAIGDIRADSLRADVAAATGRGNIHIRTTGGAEAHAVHGSIVASIGATNWRREREFSTTDGDVEVELPADANTEVFTRSKTGTIASSIPLPRQWVSSVGHHAAGRVGDAERWLSLETVHGDVRVRRVGDVEAPRVLTTTSTARGGSR